MSDPRIQGPLSAIAVVIADTQQAHEKLPPHTQSAMRAVYGAQLLCAAWYFGMKAHLVPPMLYLGAGGIGLMMILAGLSEARGNGDKLAPVWALAVPALGAWAVMHWVPGLWRDGFGHGLCLVFLSGAAVRLLIALRGPGVDARQMVAQNINDQEWRW